MVLFLDGSSKRAALAYQRIPIDKRSNVIWCKTVEEATTTLRDYNLEEVFLEHDLGERPYQNSRREDSGMEVIRFIEKNDFIQLKLLFNHTEIIIHTWNLEAGKIMEERLNKLHLNVKHIPFGS